VSASFGKREREKKQQERAAQKRQRRADRAAQPSAVTDQPDSAALMERFRVLSEAFDTGAVNRAAYEVERREIFTDLGLADTLE
jgi:hypothetical protein